VLFAIALAPFPARAATFDVAAMERLIEVTSPQISPDASTVVVTAARADLPNDRLLVRLDRFDVRSGAVATIVPERPGLSSPAMAPDGERVAFLAPDAAGEDQIFVVRTAGGAPRRVTKAATGVEQFAWRPDGAAFAYVSVDGPPHRSGAARFRDAFHVGNDSYRATAIPPPAHLYVVGADGAGARRLTEGAWSILDGEDQTAISWSPDGKAIAFARAPDAILNDQDDSTIWLCDVATGRLRKLTGNDAHETMPLFAPRDGRIAYLHMNGNEAVAQAELFVAPAAGGEAANLSHAVDRTLLDLAWSPDGASILGAADDGERRNLIAFAPPAAPRRIDLGGLDAVTDSMLYAGSSPLRGTIASTGTIAFVGAGPQSPSELYVAEPGRAPKRLSSYNAFASALSLPRSEAIWYDGPDGFAEEAVLMYPPGYVAGRAYPLMVKIHGGPDLAKRMTFEPLPQLMAARGWLVVEPNYRGSTNLGLAYQRAVAGEPSAGPDRDILAAIDAVRKRATVDESRVGVSGWSYGGQLTAWMIAKHHFWRAAMVGAPVTDMVVDYSTADDLNGYPPLFGGRPPFVNGDAHAAYLSQSPITYVADIVTPVLIMHNTGDARCPIVNSYLLFRALRDLGRPVDFVAYPIDVHEAEDAGDPVRTADYYARWVNWFVEHFK